jgi:ribosomal protein S18 acetylase RimI-like enzyme
MDQFLFLNDAHAIEPDAMSGFFEKWPDPPSADRRLAALRGSTHAIVAVHREANEAAGFITALSDGAIAAYIPLLEVRPQWRSQGLGSHLVRLMMDVLRDQYMIDIVCDDDVLPFYERLGFTSWTAAVRRDREALRD